jgi:hypothetical protein
MDSVTARVVVLALGVAMSPVPIVGVLVVLLGKRAHSGGLAFAAAWVLGNATAIAVAILFAGRVQAPHQGFDLPFEGIITALLGIGLIVSAWLSRRGRFRSGKPHAVPNWVNAVDSLSPAGGAFVAFTNATTSPKNLGLAIVAGATIQSAALPWAGAPLAEAFIYVVVASLTIVTPVLMYFVYGERAEDVLGRMRTYVTEQAAAVMEIGLLVIGIVLTFKGLYNLLT